MKIDTLVLGDFETNCFVLRADENAGQCVVIDPGFEGERLVAWLEERRIEPVLVLLTHGHVDHIAGVEALRQRWPGVELAVGRGDAGALLDPRENLSAMLGRPTRVGPADRELAQGDVVAAAGVTLEVRETPGHSPGGVSFYGAADAVVFSGDSLFAQSIGRDDFPGGDRGVLLAGIREQLFSLPGETRVFPGHGPSTTVELERRTNPFLA